MRPTESRPRLLSVERPFGTRSLYSSFFVSDGFKLPFVRFLIRLSPPWFAPFQRKHRVKPLVKQRTIPFPPIHRVRLANVVPPFLFLRLASHPHRAQVFPLFLAILFVPPKPQPIRVIVPHRLLQQHPHIQPIPNPPPNPSPCRRPTGTRRVV